MPKRGKNLANEIVSWENLTDALRLTMRGKRGFYAAQKYYSEREHNLLNLQEKLISGRWHPHKYRQFEVFEPKRRIIHAPSFEDRIVHHALVNVTGPYFERRFIDHSYACRVRKGTHAASLHLWHMLKSADFKFGDHVYVLKADISKYFDSINHDILYSLVNRVIADPLALQLYERLIYEGPAHGTGMPLGCLTSQMLANLYLDPLDHWLCDYLGMHYYIRYMDDFVLLHNDKIKLRKIWNMIRDFLGSRLRLTLNRKTSLFPASRGVDFAGYRHWTTHLLPRHRNMIRASRRFAWVSKAFHRGDIEYDKARSIVSSFLGYAHHCKSARTTERVLENFVLIPPPFSIAYTVPVL